MNKTRAPQTPSSRPPLPDGAGQPPRAPADIPLLGPIRVRALQKAGYGTLEALRAATLEDLLAVPGMSEIKARHIRDYLAQFPAQPPAPALPEAQQAADLAAQIMQAERKEPYRPRLLRALQRFAVLAQSLAAQGASLSEKERTRAAKRLRRALDALSEIRKSSADRKEQGRLAEELDAIGDRLTSLAEPSDGRSAAD